MERQQSAQKHRQQRRVEWIWRGIKPCLPSTYNFVEIISAKDSPYQFTDDDVDLKSEVVASFNWALPPRGPPFMMIPGCPDRYKHWKGGKLKSGKGFMYADQNGYMNEKYPLESLFRAVTVCNSLLEKSDFDWQAVDICTDRNNLRKLYAISNGTRKGRDGPVRIDIERVGNIVMLTRVERAYTEGTGKGNYGHPFENMATDRLPGVPFTRRTGDGSFRCIKRVKFGGLTMLVRFEVDAADFSNVSPDVMEAIGLSMYNFETPRPFHDQPRGLLYSVAPTLKLPKKDDGVLEPSLPVQHVSLMELTTSMNFSVKANKWPQLYFSGTNSLVVGRHDGDNFSHINEIPLEKMEADFGGRPVESLKNFAKLLNSLVDLVRRMPEKDLLVAIWDPARPNHETDELVIGRRPPSSFIRAAPPKVLSDLKSSIVP